MRKQAATKLTGAKRSLIVILVTSSIMVASIASIYFNSQPDGIATSSQCESASYSTSVDGSIVINEADLGCLGESQGLQDSRQRSETIASAAAIIGAASFLVNGTLLIRLYRKA